MLGLRPKNHHPANPGANDPRWTGLRGALAGAQPKKKKRLKKGEAEVVPFDTVILRLAIAGKHRNKGFLAELTLKTTPRVIDGTWVATGR